MIKIGLGSAQFGLDYGTFVPSGRVPPNEIEAIAKCAENAGISVVDTAVAYGDAEHAVGRVFGETFRIVTKLPPLPALMSSEDVSEWVKKELQGSMDRLDRPAIYGLLLHHSQDLKGERGRALAKAMNELKFDGLVERVGISIYEPSELNDTAGLLTPTLVQCPFNFFDKRIADSGWAQRLYDQDCNVHVRSVFLQGVLLLEPECRPRFFDRFSGLFSAWDARCESFAGDRIAAALSGVLSEEWCSSTIVGVSSTKQLQAVLRSASGESTPYDVRGSAIEAKLDELIDPRLWR